MTDFHGDQAKKIQNGRFSKSPILKKKFRENFMYIGLVGLIDAKGIDVAKPTVFP